MKLNAKKEEKILKQSENNKMAWDNMKGDGPALAKLIFIEIARFHFLSWNEAAEVSVIKRLDNNFKAIHTPYSCSFSCISGTIQTAFELAMQSSQYSNK